MLTDAAARAAGSPLDLDSRPLSDLAPRLAFRKGQKIGTQGQPCDRLYILAEGQVLLNRRSQDGHEHALYLLGPGDLFGEGALRPEHRWLVTARAVTDGAAHVLPAPHLPRLAQYYPQLMAHILTLLSGRLERAHRRLDVITTHGARERLLGLLNVIAGNLGEVDGDEVWVPLQLTQAQLADMIGLARETVSRLLADLEEEGVIRRKGHQGLWLCQVPPTTDTSLRTP
jgi:CRP/FNR family transcriptional regulator, cyclic AMP receptor protein